jgi:hypothetical protein
VLTTQDGKRHYFTGNPTLIECDTIIDIKIGAPKELPEGITFTTMEEIDSNDFYKR